MVVGITEMPPKAALWRQLHALYVTRGTQEPLKWTRLMKGYLSYGFAEEALLIYTQNLPDRIHQPILPFVLKVCASHSLLSLGQSLHAECIKLGMVHELFVGTTFVSMYCKCHRPAVARKLFDEMPERNVVTYNAMIGGYCMNGDMELASILFDQMCSRTPVTWALTIEGFAKVGDTVAARRLFDRAPPEMRTVVTWTVMVHGYTVNGEMETARELFDRMPVRNFFVWSSMITGYFKKGDAEEARAIFNQMPVRNLVNWNALIAGYAQIGCCEEALEAFRQMLECGIEPDEFTIASVLSACSQFGSLGCGKKIHELINHKKIKTNHFVLNGLVDMYAKCGDLERAKKIFDGMRRRNSVCWNSMISGLASHGQSEEALKLFDQMEESEEKPNEITFLVILSACTHGGFVKEGLEIFEKMDKYGLVAGVEHYGCLVDLLGRAGRLAEAYDVIKKMPMKPNEVVWGALLGACRLHMDMEIADKVVHEIGTLNSGAGSTNDAQYVVLSNIYAASEKWEEAERIRRSMVENGIQKMPGCSSIMVGNTDYQFHAGAIVDSQAHMLCGA
ncbi:pentatricopeptide repeat-containing protein At3g21470 [Phoenix dactylifera]|uniref:Pentatricopeptide repeat-containing protein At3g21470 n=1 Tax=Phoenix dactylifera TaxID=42345 RepID=A0A8B7CPN2_PHODC|nr:pentatricopeptide repeat-containing protein At3g21470 [Phoenix dactylifera]